MKSFLEDLRYALRLLYRNRGFTIVAVLTLALAIGATSTIFSAVSAVLLRDLPYPDPGRLTVLWGEDRARDHHRGQICYPDLQDWRAQSSAIESAAAFSGYWQPVLVGASGAEQLDGVRVSTDFFHVLKTSPMLGRDFLPEEEMTGVNVAILSHGLWARRFGSDPNIVGRKVAVSGSPYTVVGVLPPQFQALPSRLLEHSAEIYRPLGKEFSDEIRSGRHLRAIARLKPGITLAQAQAQLDTISQRIEAANPATNRGRGVRAVGLHDDMVRDIRPALLVLQACVLMIVLIACANVANLMLARSSGRRREIAIRQAMGAARSRLVRQMLTESLALAVMGGAGGILVAFWCLPLFEQLGAKTIPELARLAIDWRVAGFAAALSMITGIIFGLVPALELSAVSPVGALREGGRGSGKAAGARRRGLLVVAESAVALVLLIAAGLLVTSFVRLRQVDAGFDGSNVLVSELSLPASRYPAGDARSAFFARLLPELRRLPGVTAAAMTNVLPESGNFDQRTMEVEGRTFAAGAEPGPDQYAVTPEYFRALGISLRRGRLFAEDDDAAHAQVALLNDLAAQRLWPGEDPVGRKVRTGGSSGPWRTVVGVVGDVYQYGLDSRKTLQIYVPYAQFRVPGVTMVLRSGGDPMDLVPAIRAQLRAIDPELPLVKVASMDQVMADSVAGRRFSMLLLAALGACAMLLAAIGIYGVTAYSVTQRTAEFGIRMALGAQTGSVIALVMRHNLLLIGAGSAIGIAASLLCTRFLGGLLFGVSAVDPVTFALAAGALAVVAMAASYIPARRATRVDPMTALRSD
ncbi:MAG TPA: ABC transporter permease [Candidatus Solibacter sp.]